MRPRRASDPSPRDYTIARTAAPLLASGMSQADVAELLGLATDVLSNALTRTGLRPTSGPITREQRAELVRAAAPHKQLPWSAGTRRPARTSKDRT